MMNLLNHVQIKTLSAALGNDAALYLVGGCVRDSLLGNPPHDFDLCTVLRPDQIEQRLSKAEIKFVVTGIRRGTVTAILDGEPFEITTFRNPANEKEFVDNIETDLAARDFTINAMAVNVLTGELVDLFRGHQDLINGLLRCVGEPERRFTEDPHRILRMARFGWGAQRIVCPETEKAAEKLSHLIVNIAPERIHDELIKIVCSQFPNLAFNGLHHAGTLKIFLPELDRCFGMIQNKHHMLDVFNHSIESVQRIKNDKVLRLAALFHDIGKPDTLLTDSLGNNHFYGHEEVSVRLTTCIMTRLRFSNEDIKSVTELISKHGFNTECGQAAVRRLLRNIGEEGTLQLIELKRADGLAGHVNDRTAELDDFLVRVQEEIDKAKKNPFIQLAINGTDVLQLGVSEGPQVGELLSVAREAVIEDPENNNREFLLNLIRQHYENCYGELL